MKRNCEHNFLRQLRACLIDYGADITGGEYRMAVTMVSTYTLLVRRCNLVTIKPSIVGTEGLSYLSGRFR